MTTVDVAASSVIVVAEFAVTVMTDALGRLSNRHLADVVIVKVPTRAASTMTSVAELVIVISVATYGAFTNSACCPTPLISRWTVSSLQTKLGPGFAQLT